MSRGRIPRPGAYSHCTVLTSGYDHVHIVTREDAPRHVVHRCNYETNRTINNAEI